MTNEEAIEYLKEAQSHIDLENGGNTQKMYDALELAIGKLQATGEPKCKIRRRDFGFEWPVKEANDE